MVVCNLFFLSYSCHLSLQAAAVTKTKWCRTFRADPGRSGQSHVAAVNEISISLDQLTCNEQSKQLHTNNCQHSFAIPYGRNKFATGSPSSVMEVNHGSIVDIPYGVTISGAYSNLWLFLEAPCTVHSVFLSTDLLKDWFYSADTLVGE